MESQNKDPAPGKREPQYPQSRRPFPRKSPIGNDMGHGLTCSDINQSPDGIERSAGNACSSGFRAHDIWASKLQPAWNTATKDQSMRCSLPEMRWQWSWNSRRTRLKDQRASIVIRVQDEEDSKFSESLVGLMERTGKYDWMDFQRSSQEISEQSRATARKKFSACL